jgi:hypothetical protein
MPVEPRPRAYVLDVLGQGAAPVPEQWMHDCASGAVSFRYSGSENTCTWDAEAVAGMPIE